MTGTLAIGCGSEVAPATAEDAGGVDTGSLADTSTVADSTGDTAVVDGGCNALANTAPVVSVVAVPSAPPTLTGGTIVPGTYQSTKVEAFTGSGGSSGPTGKTFQETVLMGATRVDVVVAEGTVGAGSKEAFRGTFSYVTGGDNLALAPLCGFKDGVTEKYAAETTASGGNVLRILLPSNTVLTLTRVP